MIFADPSLRSEVVACFDPENLAEVTLRECQSLSLTKPFAYLASEEALTSLLGDDRPMESVSRNIWRLVSLQDGSFSSTS